MFNDYILVFFKNNRSLLDVHNTLNNTNIFDNPQRISVNDRIETVIKKNLLLAKLLDPLNYNSLKEFYRKEATEKLHPLGTILYPNKMISYNSVWDNVQEDIIKLENHNFTTVDVSL